MSSVRIVAVIPARMASSRFPGKPLVTVRELPMIEHVRRRALLCRRFCDVVVATCDREIAETVERSGGTWLMTSPSHPGATDRVAEAMRRLDCTHVVNVQGDELLVLPGDLERMVCAMEAEPTVPVWNAVAPIEDEATLRDPSVVKCALSVAGRVLFCARNLSAWAAGLREGFQPIRWVVGVLGYRRDVLERYGNLPRTPLEQAEGVDQSRILEHDILLRAVEFRKAYPGLNEPRELALIERLLEDDPVQAAVLEEIIEGWPAPLSM